MGKFSFLTLAVVISDRLPVIQQLAEVTQYQCGAVMTTSLFEDTLTRSTAPTAMVVETSTATKAPPTATAPMAILMAMVVLGVIRCPTSALA
jgi:hypothetical protein